MMIKMVWDSCWGTLWSALATFYYNLALKVRHCPKPMTLSPSMPRRPRCCLCSGTYAAAVDNPIRA